MTLYIKNMVCARCILAVKQELDKLHLMATSVRLGEIDIGQITPVQIKALNENLVGLGFEILDSQRQKHIEKIKGLIIEKVQSCEVEEHFSISEFLSKSLHKDYSYISRLFSEVEGVTIEQYFIFQKIEKVKEWLVYGELNLSEISFHLGYSSVAHLSAQFKKVTGLTPTHFKKMGASHRHSLDNLHLK